LKPSSLGAVKINIGVQIIDDANNSISALAAIKKAKANPPVESSLYLEL
jgi:hypothetical protein